MSLQTDPHPNTWFTTNGVGVPAPVIAGTAFNEHPVPLAIAGVRESHPGLFALLDQAPGLAQAGEVFDHYMALAFGLETPPPPGPRRWRAGYRRLLQGWGMDSNGPAGAVLKGWVESRFGLVPWFHKAPLARFPSTAWMQYLTEKASPRWQNNCIAQQLDLLFTYCQWSIARFAPFGDGQHVALWRATTRVDEQVVQGALRQGARPVLRLNNLVSFALAREQADCFGDWMLHTRVPTAKLLFYPGLLPPPLLAGEGEVLALGGDYEVELSYL